MSREFACRICGSKIEVAQSDQPETVTCRNCGATIMVPPRVKPTKESDDGDADRSTTATASDGGTMVDRVRDALDKMEAKKKSIWANLATLAVTLILFFGAGFFESGVTGVVVIVAVILIHELGHLLGMKLFGYRDVKMFFIPFFGAAVSGRATITSSSRKAIVTLLGPLPGVIIGLVLAIAYMVEPTSLLYQLAATFLFINGFNLLPLHPLDGGRVLDQLIFSRWPGLELAYKVLAALALGLLAYLLESIFLGFLAFFTLATLRHVHIQNKVLRLVRKEIERPEVADESKVPTSFLQKAVPHLEAIHTGHPGELKAIVANVQAVWKRFCTQHARIGPVVGLMLSYLAGVLLSVGGVFLVLVAGSTLELTYVIETRTSDNGSVTMVQVGYDGEEMRELVELSEDSLFHGSYTEFYPLDSAVSITGEYRDGLKHGVWRYYEVDGDVIAATVYEMGKPVDYQLPEDDSLVSVPEEDWPFVVSLETSYERQRATPTE